MEWMQIAKILSKPYNIPQDDFSTKHFGLYINLALFSEYLFNVCLPIQCLFDILIVCLLGDKLILNS